MFGYKCDKCGRPVNVDPGEERMCDECREKHQAREQTPEAVYQPRSREVQRAG